MEAIAHYADMLPLPRPASSRHAHMTRPERSAQFSPFAALTGYDAALAETARRTCRAPELAEDEIALLDRTLHLLAHEPTQEAVFVCFIADETKPGGCFARFRGRICRTDRQTIALDSGQEIPIESICAIEPVQEGGTK